MKSIKNEIKIFVLIYFLLFSFGQLSAQDLSKFYKIDIPDNINIQIYSSDYKSYLKNMFNAKTHIIKRKNNYTDLKSVLNANQFYHPDLIQPLYKRKKFKGVIILKNKKKINIEARLTGEYKDHITMPLASLKISVKDKSYYGIRKFKLFLPKTRGGNNEVFWSLILKKYGFPTYYTKIINIDLNGIKYKAIFQEDSSKEFLERNNIKEAPIYKINDFKYHINQKSHLIYDEIFSESFLVDNKNFLKNKTSALIASNGISLLNSKKLDDIVYKNSFFEKIHKNYSLNHALDPEQRRFIYIPYDNLFYPLYYDGNINFLHLKKILTSESNTVCQKNFLKENLLFKNYLLHNLNSKYSKIYNCALLNIENIYSSFSEKNFKHVSSKFNNIKYLEISKKIKNFLEKNDVIKYSKIKKNELIYSFSFKDNFYKCIFNINSKNISSCHDINLEEYIKLITKNYHQKKPYKADEYKFYSFPINLGNIDFNYYDKAIDYKISSKEMILDHPKLYKIDLSKINHDTNFIIKNSKTKILFYGKANPNISFSFEGIKLANENNNSRYDKLLLTGCITFSNVQFYNNSILTKNFLNCEDSINIINSRGSIKDIKIFNSLTDALDIDNSYLNLNYVEIKNAKNDCIDLSFGNYFFKKIKTENCHDKSVSVGEKSLVNIDDIEILDSKTGVVSKDTSKVILKSFMGKSIKSFCLSAYNKKQEFEGATIFYNNLNCNTVNLSSDSYLNNDYSTYIYSDASSEIKWKELN